MVDVYATDDEKVEQLKQWWKDNGKALAAGLTLGLLAVFGWRTWAEYEQRQAELASMQYTQVLANLQGEDVQQTAVLGERVLSEFSGSSYAVLTALAIAKSKLAEGQPQAALEQLQWAVEHADQPSLRELARLRLGRLALDLDRPELTEQAIEGAEPGGFAPAFAELRGDWLARKGQYAQAHAAYAEALQGLESAPAMAAVLRLKLQEARAQMGEPAS